MENTNGRRELKLKSKEDEIKSENASYSVVSVLQEMRPASGSNKTDARARARHGPLLPCFQALARVAVVEPESEASVRDWARARRVTSAFVRSAVV